MHARSSRNRTAIHAGGTALSYGEVQRETNRFANLLASNDIQQGDHIGFYTPNVPEYIIGYFGALKYGAVPIPVNKRFPSREVEFIINDVKPELFFTHSSLTENISDLTESSIQDVYVFDTRTTRSSHIPFTPALRRQSGSFDPVACQNHETANIMFTSGTTGDPKGVIHHHGYLHAFAAARTDFFDLSESDVGLIVSPLFHISGQGIMLMAAYLGCPMVLLRGWSMDGFFEAVERHKASFMHLITTIVTDIVDKEGAYFSQFDTESIEVVLTGGGSIHPDQIRFFESVIGGYLSEGYGRTEGGTAYNPLDERVFGSNGVPLENSTEIRVVDTDSGEPLPADQEGEIRVRGDGVSNGYLNRPESNAVLFDEDGWMKTGDTGYFTDDGFLYFTGRMDDVIKTGGENVRPKEVEEIVLDHPDVAEVAVVGRPHSRWGEEVVAVVVTTEKDVNTKSITAHCREHLAGFKVPRQLVVVDELTKQGTRKVNRQAARQFVVENSS